MPKVTVLMPVYNASPYIDSAISSILNQTFDDFEFLIFNDGSTDNSEDKINSYNDKRIQFFDSKTNVGHVHHLNHGIEIAKGEYIARMDADDISLPNRIKKQVDFMDNHPEVGICGTWFKIIDSNSTVKHPTKNTEIRLALLTNSAIGHPTAMLRNTLLQQYNLRYDASFVPAEDYLLWVNATKYCQLANLPEVLLKYRVHTNQISIFRKTEQSIKAQIIRKNQIEILLNRTLNEDENLLHKLLFQEKIDIKSYNILNLEEWIDRLIAVNLLYKIYPENNFSRFLKQKFNNIYKSSYTSQDNSTRNYNLENLKDFWLSKENHFLYFSNLQKIIFSIKCLIRYPRHTN